MNKDELVLGKQYALKYKGELVDIATYTEDELHGKCFMREGADSNVFPTYLFDNGDFDEWHGMDDLIKGMLKVALSAWITDVRPEDIFDNAMKGHENVLMNEGSFIKEKVTTYLKEIMSGPGDE